MNEFETAVVNEHQCSRHWSSTVYSIVSCNATGIFIRIKTIFWISDDSDMILINPIHPHLPVL